MKILTVLGTRPEIIRLSCLIGRLDKLCDHVLVHTGQNYDPKLKDIFFHELGVRAPDRCLDAAGNSFGQSIARIFERGEAVLRETKPDRVLILGDTNSSLMAVVAKRMGIPVFHMEAGNRCYDDRVPEEVNRRIIDHSSDVLLPYTERSRANLLREGIAGERILVTGNPIYEVMRRNERRIAAGAILRRLRLKRGGYFLVTAHREENVDAEQRLRALVDGLDRVQRAHRLPMIVSTHPRTRKRLESFGIATRNAQVRFLEPFGFCDFVALERGARVVLTDSGTVQEECCILRVPAVTLRDTTERPETLECGSNILSGVEPESVLRCVNAALAMERTWDPPPEYLAERVSETVARIVLGYLRKP